jgi:hypothetical protein
LPLYQGLFIVGTYGASSLLFFFGPCFEEEFSPVGAEPSVVVSFFFFILAEFDSRRRNINYDSSNHITLDETFILNVLNFNKYRPAIT